MRSYVLTAFGLQNLRLEDRPTPQPGPGEILLNVHATSLNFRDVMVINGWYNPKLRLPAVPLSDAAGVVAAVGPGVTRVQAGDRVMTHFVAAWIDGPVRSEYRDSTLGTPGPGLAAEQAVLPAEAVLPMPAGYDFTQAATLPIAALTAWSTLRSATHIEPGQTVLTLGTGGVSVFVLQLAKRMGARVIITSSSDEKLDRARQLGADELVNYRSRPDWDRRVLELTAGRGADLTVENGGVGTFDASLRATRAGGTIAFLGALTGLKGEVNLGPLLMNRLTVAGIFVDSRRSFENLVAFLTEHPVMPIIDQKFPLEQLPDALRRMEAGRHFGKLVVEIAH